MILDKADIGNLVAQARQGHEESLSQLSSMAEPRIRAYIHRVTLDPELTDDLVQETLLLMVKSLASLKKKESFWPWLYRIALRVIQTHYRKSSRQPAFNMSAIDDQFLDYQPAPAEAEGVDRLIEKELARKVFVSMGQLKEHYRAAIALRCFDNLSYEEVGEALGCTGLTARMLFFRAKKALQRRLARQGIRKASFILALGLFGRLTAPAEAAGTGLVGGGVASGSLAAGVGGSILVVLTSKITMVVTSVAAVIIGGWAITRPTSWFPLSLSMPSRANVISCRFTEQSQHRGSNVPRSLSKGAYEQWLYFPDGVDGPMLSRMQRWTADEKGKLCAWLQDEYADYYYESGTNTIYNLNYNLFRGGLRVRQLPCDPPEMKTFINKIEGGATGVEWHIDCLRGMPISRIDHRFVDVPDYKTTYEYNTLTADDFIYGWGDNVPVKDHRDAMHKRGWMHYTITGDWNGHTIEAEGFAPIYYANYCRHRPWLKVAVDGKLRYLDTPQGALALDEAGKLKTSYASSAFFAGLGRPWSGLHVVDTVRRDGALRQCPFLTTFDDNYTVAAIIISAKDSRLGECELIYDINLDNDLIEELHLRTADAKGSRECGRLTFTYIDVNPTQAKVEPPAPPALPKDIVPSRRLQASPGPAWLLDMAI
ncbi:MAG: RNA polymerase sigma factor [Sedimentisphaerales bacterium]|nr:RNA polymerase sigma factor [Sedimentisphaerales bacterium]